MFEIRVGHVLDVLRDMPSGAVQCVVTSPPYWGLRDYGLPPIVWGGDSECEHEWGDHQTGRVTGGGNRSPPDNKWLTGPVIDSPSVRSFCLRCGAWRGSLGLEPVHDCLGWATGEPCGVCYVCHLVEVFREVWRVLRDDGTLWLNLGDSYAGSWGNYAPGGIRGQQRGQTVEGKRWERPAYDDTSFRPPTSYTNGRLKPKDLVGIPWRVALALQADGWYLRNDIIWAKTNSMPEGVRDRCTKSHEYVFLLSKSRRYFFDTDAIREPLKPKTYTTFGTKHQPQGNDALGKVKSDNWGSSLEIRTPKLNANGSIAGANKRTVWTVAQPIMRLRKDLDNETRKQVIGELVERGLL